MKWLFVIRMVMRDLWNHHTFLALAFGWAVGMACFYYLSGNGAGPWWLLLAPIIAFISTIMAHRALR